MTSARLYAYVYLAFFLGAGVMTLIWLHFTPEPIKRERVWLDKPHTTADIDDVRCYYWHNPKPYSFKQTFKACEIHKR